MAPSISLSSSFILHPLSIPQREIWFDQMRHDGVPLYNIGGYVDLPGRIDPALFEQATNLLVRRHDSLRLQLTSERDEDGLPLQIVVDPWPVRVPVVDVSGEADPEAAAHDFMRKRFEEAFELEGQPLFYYDLIKLADDHFYWFKRYHHLIVDVWAVALLNRSLAGLYSDLLCGRVLALQAPSYGDYIADDQAYLKSAEYQRNQMFWRHHHPHPPEPQLKPFYLAPFGGAMPGSGCEPMILPRPFYERLGSLADAIGVSRFHVLLGALYVYFARTGECDEVTIGLPVHNRANAIYKQTAGLFTKQSPVRFACGRELSFTDLLKRISETLKPVYRHRRFPTSQLRPAAGWGSSSARLFEVSLSYLNHDYDASFGGINGHFTMLQNSWQQTPLQIYVCDFHVGEEVRIDLVYNKAYCSNGEILRLKERFRFVLETALSDPSQSIASWPILSEAERGLIESWQQGPVVELPELRVHELFEQQVMHSPEAIALVFHDQQLTYSELNARAYRIAHHLIDRGVGPEVIVAVCLERSIELIVVLVAILKAGGAYLPLDPAWQEQRRLSLLGQIDPTSPIVFRGGLCCAMTAHSNRPAIDLSVVDLHDLSCANPSGSEQSLDAAAYLMFTSGSTGVPKGVIIEHKSLAARVHSLAELAHLQKGTRMLAHTTCVFDISVLEIFVPLSMGASLVLASESQRRDPQALMSLIAHSDTKVLQFTPSLMRELVAAGLSADAGRTILIGGEPLDADLAHDLFGLSARLINVYGPTEATIWCTSSLVRNCEQTISIGAPLAGVKVCVLDNTGQPCPIGIPGELHIGGSGLARGYLNNPELTAERFIVDPFCSDPTARLYRSGDLASWNPDGSLAFHGRLDQQIKLRGFRIEPGEIEAALLAHPAVAQAAVVLRQDDAANPRLVAYWVPSIGPGEGTTTLRSDQLRAFLGQRLPDYMVPAAFVELAALPLTANGKLDRRALPAPSFCGDAEQRVAPCTDLERQLHGLWAEVLGHGEFGIDDSFFLVGGHSLAAARLLSRIEQAYGSAPPVAALFQHPTISGLVPQLVTAQGIQGSAAVDHGIPCAEPLAGDWPPGCQAFPASFAQMRLWFLHQLEPQLSAYHLPFLWRLNGDLDTSALRRALSDLMERHPTLRSSFMMVGDGLVQLLHPPAPFPLEAEGLPALDVAGRDGKEGIEGVIDAWLKQEATTPFDLSSGLLLRARLLHVAEQEHLLLLNHHHIASDGWSVAVLWRDLVALYDAQRNGTSPELRPLSVQYQDYAVWQRQRLSGSGLQELQSYWIAALSGLQPLELPSDRPRPATPSYRGGSFGFKIPAGQLEPFEALCRTEGATLQMGLFALVALLLHRYSRQDDFAIGVPIWGRNHPDLEPLIGFFVNTLPIRTRFEPEQSFRELLVQVRDTSIDAYDHQELPFEQMVEALNVERDTSRNPLVQVMLQLMELPELSLQGLDGLGVELLDGRTNSSRFDLEFFFRRQEQGLQVTIGYSTDLFNSDRIDRVEGHFTTLIDGVLADPERTIGELSLLTAAEKSSLQAWEQGPRRPAPKLWVHQSIAAEAQRRPEATAVVAIDRSLTYRELTCSSGRLAQLLIVAGVGPDVVVGLSVQRTSQLPIGLVAILQAGGTYLPLDPELPPARLHTLLADSGAQVVLVDNATRERIRAAARGSMDAQAKEPPALNLTLMGIQSAEEVAEGSDAALQPFVSPELHADTAAYLLYTSGSTGAPKAVLVEHAAIADRCQSLAELWQLDQDQVVLANAGIGFDMSLRELLLPLMVGAKVVITGDAQRKDPEAISALIERNRCTRLNATPSLWALLASRLSTPWPMVLISGGEVLNSDLANALLSGSKIRLINAYGPTEGTITSCMQPVEAPVGRQPPIGRPLPNTELMVLDPGGQRCPVGVPGDLHIGGAGLARGYHQRPEITADRFILHPHAPGRRLYRSGDLASWNPDGTLAFHGRIDGQIKLRGFRIEPGEIETHLLAHPAVAQAVVVLREEDPANPRLIAYWVPQEESRSTPGSDQLRAHLAEMLPDYMVPAAFVSVKTLPLTINGKLDRQALPASDFSADPSQRDEPSTDLEHQLHGIWEEVLGHGEFGVSDNFFYVGGHSLAAARLMSRIEQVLGSALPLAALFQNPTIAGLAPLLPLQEAKVSAGIPTAEPLIGDWPTDTQVFPASFAQARLWFLQALEPALTAYHMPTLWHLQGELDPEALRLAFEQLLERQVSLRTAYRLQGEQVLQMLSSLQPFCLRHTRLPDDVSPEALDNLLQAECSAPFDLKHGPLLRALLIERGPGDHLLLITVHHIASDGWSKSLLHQELSAFYNSLCTGAAIGLLPSPIQYADFSVWQRHQLNSGRREQLLGYWRRQLANLEPLELPTDFPRPALPSYRGASLVFELDGANSSGLECLCQQQGATLQMGLLALVAVLLQRYSRSDDIPIGVPHWGRDHPDLEGLVGFFVNILVLRCDLSEGPNFLELLRRVRSTSLEAYEHQDLPFEEVVEALQPERERSRHPLVQVQIQLLDYQESALNFHGLVCDRLPGPELGAKLDLSFYFRRLAGGLQCNIVYSSDLFTRGRIERLVDNLRMLLDGVLADPGKPIRQLPLLGPAELSQLQRWGIGPSRPTPPLGLHELFQQQVLRTPMAVAVLFEQESLSYSQLDLRVEALATVLRDRGARPGALVGVCLQRSLELPAALLAVLRSGAAYVAMDPAYPQERQAHILRESEPLLLVTNRALATALPFDAAGLVLVEEAIPPEAVPASARPAWPVANPEAAAYVLYTSGSTGHPKGVVVPHRAVVNRLIGMQEAYPLSAADVVLQKTPFSFDVSVWEIFWPLSVGARLVLARPDGHRDPDHLVALIRQQRVTALHFVPPMLALFLQHPEAEQCTSLRRVFTGGESLPRSLQDRFFVQFDADLHHLYGPTEATIDVTAWVCHRTSHLPFVPIGRPLQNVHLYLLDSALNHVPIGAVGELFIGGPQVALGYLNRPDLTSERFLPDPFSADPQARLFRSGDLCRWRPSGDLEFLGRQDGQVKIRGIRIELGEIEAVLSQQSGVSQCVVVVEGEEGDRRLVAYLTTDEQHGPDPAELRQNLLAVLPEVMVPSRYVLLEALPLTRTGKIDRNGLLSAPRRLVEDRRQTPHPPQTQLHKHLHGLWAELLGHDEFGIHDDFFMLGGHSLAAVRLAWALQELGLFLPMGRIFSTPTIAGLAAAVSEAPGPVAIPRLTRKSRPPGQA
jgi:amino acid adenylation domain-containing protein